MIKKYFTFVNAINRLRIYNEFTTMSNLASIKGKGFDTHPENIKKGRDKGSKNRATILRKWIDVATKVKDPATGKETTGTIEDEIKLALIIKAKSGDVAAIKEIDDTLYGKIADKAEVKTDENINITYKIVKSD